MGQQILVYINYAMHKNQVISSHILHFKLASITEITSHAQKFMENFQKLKLSALELKILINIQLGVICTDMIECSRPGHICHTASESNLNGCYISAHFNQVVT